MSFSLPKNNLVSITDITSYIYCPRKLYLTKILKLSAPPNPKMIIGKLKHEILELFSKNEEKLVCTIEKNYDKIDLVLIYQDYLTALAENVFIQHRALLESMRLYPNEILKTTLNDFSSDLKIRISSLKNSLNKGFTKEALWKDLDTIYISELKVESLAYGLRGRVDRIEISKKTGQVIPYELKTRLAEKVYYSDELQLTAYAMLLEDMYKQKIKKGFIEAGSGKQEIEITEEHKDNVLKLAEEVRNLSKNPPPPILSNFSKCAKCEFQEDCQKI